MDKFNLIDFYNTYKSSFFTVSLTMGTFLFTMTTFIVNLMKKEVYDTKEYQEKILQRNKENESANTENIYKPLSNLRYMLLSSVVVSLIGGIVHLIAGAIKEEWVIIIAVLFSIVSIACVFISVVMVSFNISKMFDIAEEKSNPRKRASR